MTEESAEEQPLPAFLNFKLSITLDDCDNTRAAADSMIAGSWKGRKDGGVGRVIQIFKPNIFLQVLLDIRSFTLYIPLNQKSFFRP